MLVTPPPPAVPRWMVTNSRMTLRSPITRRVGSPPNFRSCGTRPIEAIGKISLPSPISVTPSMTHDAPIRQSRPIVTCSPMVTYGPMTVPAPMRRVGMDDGGRMDIGCRAGFGFRLRLPFPAPSPARPRRRRCRRSSPRRSAARCRRAADRPSLPRSGGRRGRRASGTSRCRRRAARRGEIAPSPTSRMAATCAIVSIISTPGISGAPGKCPWKKSSLTLTFLTALTRRPGSCSEHGVNERATG